MLKQQGSKKTTNIGGYHQIFLIWLRKNDLLSQYIYIYIIFIVISWDCTWTTCCGTMSWMSCDNVRNILILANLALPCITKDFQQRWAFCKQPNPTSFKPKFVWKFFRYFIYHWFSLQKMLGEFVFPYHFYLWRNSHPNWMPRIGCFSSNIVLT